MLAAELVVLCATRASRAVGGRLWAGGDSGDLGGSCGKGQLVARPPTPLGCGCFAADRAVCSWWGRA